MSTAMRAKMVVTGVQEHNHGTDGAKSQETLTFTAVGPSTAYPADGHDDDNTYARWSPSANLTLAVLNPALFGKFKPGQKFYVDFTEAAS